MNKCILAALGLLFLTAAAVAQDDPPGRVGRLSYVDGTASFHNGDEDQWSPASLNYPVIAGQSYWTEPRSRLELEVGAAALRLDGTTLLDVLALDDATTRFRLDQGVLQLDVASLPRGGLQVLTPVGWVTINEPGSYHLDAGHPDGDQPAGGIVLTTFSGSAEFDGPRSRVAVLANEAAAIGGDPLTAQLVPAETTPFDDWAARRERRAEARAAQRYLSPEATGYQDLDDHGRWGQEPEYGTVWYPTDVPSNWQPYHDGHWAWVPPWGWTWVDDAPWGFAPFHYGRWVEVRGRWGWCPGERVERPVYAPALVAFIGGAGFGVAIAAGAPEPAVGWVPLAPGEVYHPTYPVSRDYVREVNVTSVSRTEINNITVNNITINNGAGPAGASSIEHFRNRQAAAVVPAAAFVGAAPVQHATVAIPHEELAHAPVAADLKHLPPSAAARAGVVVPAAATVPHGNAPARLAPAPATPIALAPAAKEAPPPAHGPAIVPHDQRQSHLPPPPTTATPGAHPPAPVGAPQEPRDAHLPPPPVPGHAPAIPGNPPAALSTLPQEHRDAHLPPPPVPGHPAIPPGSSPPALSTTPQEHRDAHLPPPPVPGHPAIPPGNAASPQDHRDAHLPPPAPTRPSNYPPAAAPPAPAAAAIAPPKPPPLAPQPAAVAPPKPPPPPAPHPAAVAPPKPPPPAPPPAALAAPKAPPPPAPPPTAVAAPKPPPTVAAPKPPPPGAPAHGAPPPPRDKEKDKKDEQKPNG
jgi:hypothetical protein